MRCLGLEPDPWQAQVLDGGDKRLLLNCSRQAGKSTAVAILALTEALYKPCSLVLILSRSLRQSTELFRLVTGFHGRLRVAEPERRSAHELCLTNQSRIISLPCSPDTVRGFARVSLLVIDEAARVPDELYSSVRPMLAVSNGRLVCLSTPRGKYGFFYEAWANGGPDWVRIEVPATAIPRITAEFLAEERREIGEPHYRQEYCCSFEAMQGLVYPDFGDCVVPRSSLPPEIAAFCDRGFKPARTCHPVPTSYRMVGGLDFGFRNPFAALWGVIDRDDVLWLVGEHYDDHKPLRYHAQHMPRSVNWYADPAGAREICELRCAGFCVRRGDNDEETGIPAVTARLADGSLRVLEDACPNLLREAQLYRYDTEGDDRHSEKPIKKDDHALDALRYLVSKLDARKMARARRDSARDRAAATPGPADQPAPEPPKKWLSIWNEQLWTRLY
jgi:hypothetical protein